MPILYDRLLKLYGETNDANLFLKNKIKNREKNYKILETCYCFNKSTNLVQKITDCDQTQDNTRCVLEKANKSGVSH